LRRVLGLQLKVHLCRIEETVKGIERNE
jgi:hypothetical protein